MRLHFPNTTRVKKGAKYLANQLSVPLSTAQRAVARGFGYRDWHDMDGQIASGPVCELDQDLTLEQFIQRQKELILSITRDLGAFDGDVQYALSEARLTGDRPPKLEEQIAIRLTCWRETSLPLVGARESGAVGILKTPGRNGEVVILRSFGRPTLVVSSSAIVTVADFEYVSPRHAPALFLPMRLYLPYGFWTEQDGARVIFSRDYHPLWRIRAAQSPERLKPWQRIGFKDQTFLWNDARVPWNSAELFSILIKFLQENGLNKLPVLADALPLLVHEKTRPDLCLSDCADLLKIERGPIDAVV